MDIRVAIEALVNQENLSKLEMQTVMSQVMSGKATDAQIGAFLVALRLKGETIEEIVASVEVMRSLVKPVNFQNDNIVDLVGTGGDNANLFNVSTGASFVAAAAGAIVAKHGNRSVSSSSGSSDLLEHLGIPLQLGCDQISMSLEKIGIGFMFAPNHHVAMKHAIAPRREIGLRTLFNILGPLTNPAGVKRQVIGVYAEHLCEPIAASLAKLGSEHVMVVHSRDGLDEISIAADTFVCELREGSLNRYMISPLDFDLPVQELEGLQVRSVAESAELIKGSLDCRKEAVFRKASNMLAINAGATLYVAGVASSLREGVSRCIYALNERHALAKLNEFIKFTNSLSVDHS